MISGVSVAMVSGLLGAVKGFITERTHDGDRSGHHDFESGRVFGTAGPSRAPPGSWHERDLLHFGHHVDLGLRPSIDQVDAHGALNPVAFFARA
jgi:hypothetical protein